jgi:hypothetical protein
LKLYVSVQKRNNRNNLFRNKPKKTKKQKKQKNEKKEEKKRKTPKFSVKNSKICSLPKCFGWSSVCFGSIETSKLSVSV